MHLKKHLAGAAPGREGRESPRNAGAGHSRDSRANEGTGSGKKLIHNTSLKFTNNRKANGSPTHATVPELPFQIAPSQTIPTLQAAAQQPPRAMHFDEALLPRSSDASASQV